MRAYEYEDGLSLTHIPITSSIHLLDLDCFTGADIGSFSAIAGIALITDYPGLLIPEFEDFGAYFNA